jgi:glycosyltransferase involved in cell wall biosynthesis
MNVCVSVCGRFHAFDLASELHNRKCLKTLFTSYPAFKTRQWNIPEDRTYSFPIYEMATRAWNLFPKVLKRGTDLLPRLYELFDNQVSTSISAGTDVFVGWSGMCLRSMARAKAMGATTVVERGSCHISFQKSILDRESEITGARMLGVHSRTVENELREYNSADFISVPSSFARRTFISAGVNASKVIQVPYGVDLAQFFPVPKRDSIFRIIHCGGISIRKGVHYLLQAFSDLKLKDSELWLVGSVTDEMKPILKYHKDTNVFVKGPFPQNTLRRYYSQGSVFCISSLEEGLAMVIPQAMACGLPVICTENSGGGDMVRNGVDGFVVPARDPDALKQAILTCYENRDLCLQMGDSARNRVQSGFTWKDYGDKIFQAYREMLEPRAGLAL